MSGKFEEFHDELRSVASDLLAKDAVVDWPLLAEAGWTGLEAPEDIGGAGAGFGEVAVVLEEMGRAATRSAYLGGAVLSVGALISLQSSTIRDELLRGVATGAVRTAVALLRDGQDVDASAPFGVEPSSAGLLITGRSEFVPDADGVDRLLLLANAADVPVIVVVAAQAAGFSVTPQPVVDETRRLSVVVADGVMVDESSVWRFEGDPEMRVRRLLDRAAVAVACDSVGLAEAMLSATVSYAAVRHQFGRPIGSFQAVKHACADMLVRISVARQVVSAAVDAIADDRTDATTAASMAKSYATAAAVDVVGKAMQLHGGIGYTWESGVHVYLKRAALNRSLFGSPAAHRKRLAQRYSHDAQ
jgi:alkylation response protein AidB-like acyl-CoA dehydrogenase